MEVKQTHSQNLFSALDNSQAKKPATFEDLDAFNQMFSKELRGLEKEKAPSTPVIPASKQVAEHSSPLTAVHHKNGVIDVKTDAKTSPKTNSAQEKKSAAAASDSDNNEVEKKSEGDDDNSNDSPRATAPKAKEKVKKEEPASTDNDNNVKNTNISPQEMIFEIQSVLPQQSQNKDFLTTQIPLYGKEISQVNGLEGLEQNSLFTKTDIPILTNVESQYLANFDDKQNLSDDNGNKDLLALIYMAAPQEKQPTRVLQDIELPLQVQLNKALQVGNVIQENQAKEPILAILPAELVEDFDNISINIEVPTTSLPQNLEKGEMHLQGTPEIAQNTILEPLRAKPELFQAKIETQKLELPQTKLSSEIIELLGHDRDSDYFALNPALVSTLNPGVKGFSINTEKLTATLGAHDLLASKEIDPLFMSQDAISKTQEARNNSPKSEQDLLNNLMEKQLTALKAGKSKDMAPQEAKEDLKNRLIGELQDSMFIKKDNTSLSATNSASKLKDIGEAALARTQKLAEQLQAKGGGTAKIQLTDSTVGKLELQIRVGATNNVHVEVKSGNQKIKNALEDGIDSLRSSLGNHRLNLAEFKVVTDLSATRNETDLRHSQENRAFDASLLSQQNQNGQGFRQDHRGDFTSPQNATPSGDANNTLLSNHSAKNIVPKNFAAKTNIQRGANGSLKVTV